MFDPSKSPYQAPIWNLGYRVDIIYGEMTYSAYGTWKTSLVGKGWKSGLTGQANNPDMPGVIYVPISDPPPSGQVLWGG